jgi:crotonobetainyl-CoA:carnitine CoA-transferase CaiB-like acyl-CoA transferase
VTGPFAALLLGDQGADVVKIEQPGQGDPFRGWGDNLYSSNFKSLNRNKKSMTLDLRKDEAREIFLKLAAGADIVIENFRPGTLDKRGLGYEDVKRLNPKVVYCSISGFGQTGPYRDRPGYDTVGQAMSGLLSLVTDAEKPQGVGISFSDHLTGIYACYGILGALAHRLMTGEGQRVETSLLRATVSFTSETAVRYFETGVVPRRATRVRTAGVFAFTDRDGLPFVIHLSSPEKFWRGLLDVVGKPELAEDPRFRDRHGRQKNHDALSDLLQAVFRSGAREEWLRRLMERDVPAAPLNTMDEVFADPQVRTYGFPIETEHPVMGKMKLVGSGVDLSRTPPAVTLPPPMLGEHTEAVLAELGYDKARIAQLKESGVV